MEHPHHFNTLPSVCTGNTVSDVCTKRLISYYHGKSCSLRCTGAPLLDAYQLLASGDGVLTARLNLFFQAIPIALLVENAGGSSSSSCSPSFSSLDFRVWNAGQARVVCFGTTTGVARFEFLKCGELSQRLTSIMSNEQIADAKVVMSAEPPPNAFAPALHWYVLTIFGSGGYHKGTHCLFWAHWGPLYIPPRVLRRCRHCGEPVFWPLLNATTLSTTFPRHEAHPKGTDDPFCAPLPSAGALALSRLPAPPTILRFQGGEGVKIAPNSTEQRVPRMVSGICLREEGGSRYPLVPCGPEAHTLRGFTSALGIGRVRAPHHLYPASPVMSTSTHSCPTTPVMQQHTVDVAWNLKTTCYR